MNILPDWEKRLKPFFNGTLRIIGEIPLSYADIEEISNQVKLNADIIKVSGVTKQFRDYYPLTFITLLSIFAAYNTQRDFWQAFADFVHFDKSSILNQCWHKLFVELAKKQGLKVFEFGEDPLPYVTSIRFQGGIPAYSLPDYFERMVLPAVERPILREMPIETVLNSLIKRVLFVDSPVLDFLKNSGTYGIDFFKESCRLARHAIKNHGEILPANEVDLPSYIVTSFENYMERKEDEKQHWRKPELLAAPYSEDSAVILALPEQEINLDLFTRKVTWHVEWEGQGEPLEIPCKVYRQRQSVVTKEEFRAIQATPRTVIVSIYAYFEEANKKQELRRWSLPLVPAKDHTPLIAFRKNQRLTPVGLSLPAEPLYLVFPRTSELDFVGEANQLEVCTPLVGAWQEWKMEVWDLTKVWSVQIKQDGKPVGKVIPVQGAIPQPELVDGHLYQFQLESEIPLYIAGIPSISVPINKTNNFADLNAWQIHIRSLWEASPCIDLTNKLVQFRKGIKVEVDRAIFPLSLILGENPVGTYQIDLRGPHDLRAEFRIRLWPSLFILGHSINLIQPAKETQPSGFMVRIPENALCEVQAGAEKVELKKIGGVWQVTAPPSLNLVLLDLTMPAEGGGIVRVPISIPLPKLRWGLATEQSQGDLSLGQALLHRSIDQLQQSGSAALHVEMYGLGGLIHSLKLRLVELDVAENVIQEVKFNRTDFTRDGLRAGLGQFSDSIKSVNSLAQFELVYYAEDKEADPVRISMLELSRELQVDQVALKRLSDTSWKVTWQEEKPLKNRRVMILPSWQPWQKPWEYKIPDKACAEFMIDEIAIPPSRYHLYFYIAPTWATPRKSPPDNLKPFTINLCTPQERIKALAGNSNLPNEQFKNLVEMANIHDSLGEPKNRDERLSECAKLLMHLTNLDLLMGSLKWIQSKDIDPPIKSFFFRRMYRIEILRTILQGYNLYNPTVVEYLQYAGKIKDSIPTDSAKLLLQRVDEPTAIYSSLHHLLEKKDVELPQIVVKMMEEARFSKRDALDLFALDPEWAIGKIAELIPSSYVDSLIAGLLPKVAQSETMKCEPRAAEWMIRAIPYEDDEQLVITYLMYLFISKHPRAYEILMKCFNDELIFDDDVMGILSLEPQISLDFLEQAPQKDEHQKWILYLIEKYPTAAGIIKSGNRLKTPFGIVIIDYIENRNEELMNQIRIGDPGSRLNVITGDGADRIRLQIDYRDMKVYVADKSVVWRCGQCGYINPEQKKVTRHADDEHGHVPLTIGQIKVPISFTKEEIEIL